MPQSNSPLPVMTQKPQYARLSIYLRLNHWETKDMKNTLKVIFTLIAVLAITNQANAATWRCSSYNKYHPRKTWVRARPSRYDAIVASRNACKRNSARPGACVVPSASCYRSHRKHAKCIVRDRSGRRWAQRGGKHPCKRALRNCRRWHENRGMTGWRCWII